MLRRLLLSRKSPELHRMLVIVCCSLLTDPLGPRGSLCLAQSQNFKEKVGILMGSFRQSRPVRNAFQKSRRGLAPLLRHTHAKHPKPFVLWLVNKLASHRTAGISKVANFSSKSCCSYGNIKINFCLKLNWEAWESDYRMSARLRMKNYYG